LDGLPAGRTTGPADKVAITNVDRSVPVRVVLSSTGEAAEACPVAVGALDVAAVGAALARVSRVHPDHPAASRLRLVLQEATQLRERPGVQPATGSPPALLDATTDVRQVLHDDGRARTDRLDDALRQDVIAVSPKPSRLPRELLHAAQGRLRAFGGEGALALEVAAVDGSPVPLPQEARRAGDGWPGQPEIDA